MSKLWLHHVCALKKRHRFVWSYMAHSSGSSGNSLTSPDTRIKWTSNQSAAGNHTLVGLFSVNQTVEAQVDSGVCTLTKIICWKKLWFLKIYYWLLSGIVVVPPFHKGVVGDLPVEFQWVLVALKPLEGQKHVFSLFIPSLRWTGTSTGVTVQGRKGYKSHRANSS